jgi:peptidoglycan/xylan/chitin deacetylase (PgdA/CDA1 family)
MILLHRIGPRALGSNFNSMEEILDAGRKGLKLSFDGIYKSVYENRHLLAGLDITLFVMGRFVGGNNRFDIGQPYGEYCTWDEIFEIQTDTGAKLGYHSFSHKNLSELSDDDLLREIHPPFPMDYFAYPAGIATPRVINVVKECGYKEAWTVHQGDGSQFQRKRRYLNW